MPPAFAGRASRCLLKSIVGKVHPRACGEDADIADDHAHLYGSPPRMRGRLDRRKGVLLIVGFTPAHAGKTRITAPRSLPREVHPRACGEDAASPAVVAAIAGSPPQVRGRLAACVDLAARARFTPAHAGKTRLHSPFVRRGRCCVLVR